MTPDLVLTDCSAATMAGAGLGVIEDAAVAISADRIAWVGPRADAPTWTSPPVVSLGGRWITPGLIDCHTHLVFGGDRAHEFELRLKGATYEEIAKAGGGILSTVTATRAASLDDLVASAKKRLLRFMDEGVTTIEIKSGYGLDPENEAKQLRAARRLGQELEVTIRTTCLAAHALPHEVKGNADGYIDLVCNSILPAIAGEGLADAVDAFCEKIAFSTEQTAKVFDKAKALGLPVKLHADQLSDLGGAALAARFGALSADHLEYTSDEGVAALARAGTIAVLLPGAFYALRETRLPPIEAFRRRGAAMAIASDSNPGSSPALSLLLMLNMACTLFRMTPEEALLGVTANAARALGLAESQGRLEAGLMADIAVWNIARPAELAYWIGGNPCAGVIRAGRWAKRNF
jgi:imidazolonepropionase